MSIRVGVFVDASNLSANGGFRMRYDVLRELATRGEAIPMRLNTYIAFDEERAQQDAEYRNKNMQYHHAIRNQGFKVVLKPIKRFWDEDGEMRVKANADLDMAVDMLLQGERLDRVLLCTGDGDFNQVVRALQDRGTRVEVLSFDNCSSELKREADWYINGYMVPDLLPMGKDIVTGEVYKIVSEKGFCFVRGLSCIPENPWDKQYSEYFLHFNRCSDELADQIANNRMPLVAGTLGPKSEDGDEKARPLAAARLVTEPETAMPRGEANGNVL